MLKKIFCVCCEKQIETADRVRRISCSPAEYENISRDLFQTLSKYLELTELTNDSKMSIINAFTWVTAAAIYSFETLLDVFLPQILLKPLPNELMGLQHITQMPC